MLYSEWKAGFLSLLAFMTFNVISFNPSSFPNNPTPPLVRLVSANYQ